MVICDSGNEHRLFQCGDVFIISEARKKQGLEMKIDAEKGSNGSDDAWIQDLDGNDIYFNALPNEKRSDI